MLSQPRSIPHCPGVYSFWRGLTPLYVGKAADLAKRLTSYWRTRRVQAGRRAPADPKVRRMLEEATRVEWIETASEIEALLREAERIKRNRPKYNVLMRDDKGYLYVGITRETFPRIFITHQPGQTRSTKFEARNKFKIKNSKHIVLDFGFRISDFKYIGPFTSSSALKTTLRLLRRIFPYCTCKRPHRGRCLASQIGLCPGYCCTRPSLVQTAQHLEYRRNIQNLIAVLSGRKKHLTHQWKREMRRASRREDYERAGRLRDQVAGIENIFGHKPFLLPSRGQLRRVVFDWQRIEKNLKALLKTRRKIARVEGYDISTIGGQEATGSLVVFVEGVPAKDLYRKFRIRTVRGISDVDMLAEVIGRRLTHSEWPLPDLMLIDGGRGQLNTVLGIATSKVSSLKFKVAALAKREEELYLPGRTQPIRLDSLPPATAHFLQRVRDESHRFARVYHHKLREIAYRDERIKS